MKAIIIQDSDAANLLDLLKLEDLQMMRVVSTEDSRGQRSLQEISNDIHRRFHFVVCRWLQEQGANVVR